MPRIAVIGSATGQLARSLLEAAPEQVTLLGRPDLELTCPASVEAAMAAINVDIVINTAAYTAVDKAESEPELAFGVNRDGAAAVARASRRRGLPLIHISTDYVFDGRKEDGAYREDEPCNPQGAYGRSKREGELAVQASGARAVILRTAWVHSPFGNNFVKTMLRLAKERDCLRVVDDQHGSPTYAPHLVVAILTMASRLLEEPNNEALTGIFHLAGAGNTTWCGFAKEVMVASAECGGRCVSVEPITTKEFPTPAKRPANSVLDISKIKQVYGLTMPSWREGVRHCVARLLVA